MRLGFLLAILTLVVCPASILLWRARLLSSWEVSPHARGIQAGSFRLAESFAAQPGETPEITSDNPLAKETTHDETGAASPVEPHVEATYLGSVPMLITIEGCLPLPYPRNLAVSADGKRMAYWAKRGARFYVVVDGKEIGEYDYARDLQFSPDSKRYLFIASPDPGEYLEGLGSATQRIRVVRGVFVIVDGQQTARYSDINVPRFSPDGKHFAFLASCGSKRFPVVDDTEFSEYEDADMVVFSSDGKSFAFRGKRGGKEYVVLNGKPVASYDEVGDMTFIPPHNQLVYWAKTGKQWMLIQNGGHILATEEMGKPYRFFFNAEGQLLGYTLFVDHTLRFLKIGGRSFGPSQYYGVNSPQFSTDGKHFLCLQQNSKEYSVVYDGREFGPFENVESITLSADGTRWAYAARREGKCLLFVDGVQVGIYGGVGSLGFSVDGKQWACIAVRNGKYLVVVDGQEQPECDYIDHLAFSPDGSRVAYWAERNGKRFVVVDNVQVTPEYDKIRPMQLRFSKDGKHLVYWVMAYEKREVMVGVDGKIIGTAPGRDEIHYRETPDTIHYIVRNGKDIWRVELKGIELFPRTLWRGQHSVYW